MSIMFSGDGVRKYFTCFYLFLIYREYIENIEYREKFQQSDLSESLSCFHGNLLYPT